MWYKITFCNNSALKHCAANRKRWLSAFPNVGSYIYPTLKFLALHGTPYIYDISRLRVNWKIQASAHVDRYIGTRFWRILLSEFYCNSVRSKVHGKYVLSRPWVLWKGQERRLEEWPNGSSGAVPFAGGSVGNYQDVNLLATWEHVYTLT
jgi:hypothetical protein